MKAPLIATQDSAAARPEKEEADLLKDSKAAWSTKIMDQSQPKSHTRHSKCGRLPPSPLSQRTDSISSSIGPKLPLQEQLYDLRDTFAAAVYVGSAFLSQTASIRMSILARPF